MHEKNNTRQEAEPFIFFILKGRSAGNGYLAEV